MANKDELKKQAEELGITVGANWNKDQIEAEIDKALAEPAGGGDPEDEQDNDDQYAALLGSSVHPNEFKINGETVTLGDVVAAALEHSGLTPEQWNELSDEDRHAAIDAYLGTLEDEDEDGRDNEEADTFKNVASGPVFVCGHRVHRNGHYTLTDSDRRDTKGMKRLARAVELGLVEKV